MTGDEPFARIPEDGPAGQAPEDGPAGRFSEDGPAGQTSAGEPVAEIRRLTLREADPLVDGVWLLLYRVDF